MLRGLLSTVLLLGTAWPLTTRAQPSRTADQLIDQGLALRARNRDAEALALFERAYRQTPTPRAQAQIALAEGALSRWVVADRHLRAALAFRNDEWIAARRRILEDALRTIDANLGAVMVTGSATGARVRIAGEDAGSVPMSEPLHVAPGTVTIEIARPNAPVETVEVEVAAGARIEHRAETLSAITGPIPDPDPSAPDPVDPDSTSGGEGSSALSTLGWISLGIAGAALITGVIAHVLREGHAADFNANPECGTDVESPTTQCRDLEDSFDTASTVSLAGYIAAGALGTASVVMLVAGGSF